MAKNNKRTNKQTVAKAPACTATIGQLLLAKGVEQVGGHPTVVSTTDAPKSKGPRGKLGTGNTSLAVRRAYRDYRRSCTKSGPTIDELYAEYSSAKKKPLPLERWLKTKGGQEASEKAVPTTKVKSFREWLGSLTNERLVQIKGTAIEAQLFKQAAEAGYESYRQAVYEANAKEKAKAREEHRKPSFVSAQSFGKWVSENESKLVPSADEVEAGCLAPVFSSHEPSDYHERHQAAVQRQNKAIDEHVRRHKAAFDTCKKAGAAAKATKPKKSRKAARKAA